MWLLLQGETNQSSEDGPAEAWNRKRVAGAKGNLLRLPEVFGTCLFQVCEGEMKTPSLDDASKAMSLRMRTKKGEYLPPADMKFLKKLWQQYPEWYRSLDKEIWERTKPFGANQELEINKE